MKTRANIEDIKNHKDTKSTKKIQKNLCALCGFYISHFNTIVGHYQTVVPMLFSRIWSYVQRAARPFQIVIPDPWMGTVRLTGLLQDNHHSDTLVLIIHGTGGDATKPYCVAAAKAAEALGYASLRLSMRGADHSGEDIYHAGLSSDLGQVLKSPELARYQKVFLIGFSVGGHIALHAALEKVDPRLRAIAAISPPLDITATVDNLDKPSRGIYRHYLFSGLNRAYAAVAARRKVPTPFEIVKKARTWRERDLLTVIPRFGFRSLEDYYESASVGPRLNELAIPSLIVASKYDPITPADTLYDSIAHASGALTVRWVEGGGHVRFQPNLDLGQGGPLGLESQMMRWLSRQ